jgi:anti-sigma factor RsiW
VTDCEEVRLELGGYVLAGLEPHEHAAVEAHLAGCVTCRAEADDLTALPELLATLRSPTARAPADLEQRVLERPARFRWRALVVVAAAVALAALGGAAVATIVVRPPPPDAVLTLRSSEAPGVMGVADLRQASNGVRVDLDLTGVRPPDEGYYHAWLHRGDRQVSAGTFVGAADATAKVQLLCGGQLLDYDRLTVTWHGFDTGEEVVAVEAAMSP